MNETQPSGDERQIADVISGALFDDIGSPWRERIADKAAAAVMRYLNGEDDKKR